MKMTLHLFLALTFAITTNTHSTAQVAVSTTGDPPHSSAALDVQSTTGGILMPRMTTAQRDAIASPAIGLQIFNVENECIQVYVSVIGWTNLFCSPAATSSPTLVCQTGWNIPAGTTTGDRGCVTFTYRNSPVTYTTVRAADGKEWLRQNLGSAHVAASSNDTLAFGDYFQWGRWDDGHQVRTPSNLLTATASPNNPSAFAASPFDDRPFYINTSPDQWWSGGAVTDSWTGNNASEISATNGMDPCRQLLGNGWRLPTGDTGGEWAAVASAEGITNAASALSSNLRLTTGGHRGGTTGEFGEAGNGLYHSSTPHPSTAINARFFRFTATAISQTINSGRSSGKSVRCLR